LADKFSLLREVDQQSRTGLFFICLSIICDSDASQLTTVTSLHVAILQLTETQNLNLIFHVTVVVFTMIRFVQLCH